jgi:polysaccharide deacetylase 2 family uncharacterized protein YibQ
MTSRISSALEEFFSVRAFALSLTALLALTLVVGLAAGLLSSKTAPVLFHLETIAELKTDVQEGLLPVPEEPSSPAVEPETHEVAETHEETPPPPAEEISPGDLHPSETAETHAPPAAEETQPPHPEPVPEETAPAHQTATHPVEDSLAGLHESTPYGMVPITRKEDGMTAFQAYRAPFTALPDTKALVALVMVDYGLSGKAATNALSELPSGVTLSLSPYAGQAQAWTTKARERDLEVWMGMPTQSSSFASNDTGPQTILSHGSLEKNRERFLTTLGKSTGYTGIIDLDVPEFSGAESELEFVYKSIAERGLGLAQANPQDTITGGYAVSLHAPFIQNDAWIDTRPAEADIKKELEKLESLALSGRVSVGFFHPYPSAMKAIRQWQPEAAKRGIQIAPLASAIEEKK